MRSVTLRPETRAKRGRRTRNRSPRGPRTGKAQGASPLAGFAHRFGRLCDAGKRLAAMTVHRAEAVDAVGARSGTSAGLARHRSKAVTRRSGTGRIGADA